MQLVGGWRVFTREDVTEALTYTKLLPGSTVLQMVSYLGYKLGVTTLGIAWDAFTDGWPYDIIAALLQGLWTKSHPVLIVVGSAVLGGTVGALRG